MSNFGGNYYDYECPWVVGVARKTRVLCSCWMCNEKDKTAQIRRMEADIREGYEQVDGSKGS
jgi:hypothetical protein